jgi:A/G-specific adenine glycosylase
MSDFSTLIQTWYRLNKRDLPWRRQKSAYLIWISEVVLQQTQVIQGLSYYEKFADRFPTVQDFAAADEDEILKLWQGLGYYSRARNMHFAAKQVMAEFGGKFPTTHSDLLSLKGVGAYTAAAIASIAYELPHAVVDGNVYRVLSRCFLIDTAINSTNGIKEFAQLADSLLDSKHAGDHNQALMEVGAMVCKPKKPKCDECPINSKCLAFEKGNMTDFPVKEKKLKVRNRYLNYLIVTDKTNVIIKKREGSDIWKGLFDFRLLESDAECGHIDNATLDIRLKHILTHQRIYASFWISEQKNIETAEGEIKIKLNDLEDYALPQLLVKYLNQSDYFTG